MSCTRKENFDFFDLALIRNIIPRFTPEARQANQALVDMLGEIRAGKGATPAQIALAWVLAQPGITSAILGASRPEQLADSLGGVDLTLDEEERTACDDAWYSLPHERDSMVARR